MILINDFITLSIDLIDSRSSNSDLSQLFRCKVKKLSKEISAIIPFILIRREVVGFVLAA